MNKLSFSKIKDQLKKINLKDRRIIIIIAIILIVLLMMDFNGRMVLLLRLNEERDTLKTEVASLELTKISFEQKVLYATSEAALEQYAREEARMINDGDIPIIAIAPVGQSPKFTPIPAVPSKSLSNWQIWRELLLGSD